MSVSKHLYINDREVNAYHARLLEPDMTATRSRYKRDAPMQALATPCKGLPNWEEKEREFQAMKKRDYNNL